MRSNGLPRAAEPMLNMIEWWVCLSMPPDEVENGQHRLPARWQSTLRQSRRMLARRLPRL